MEQEPELKDYEFGCYAFETLPKAKGPPVGETLASVDGVDICEINISYDNAENSQIKNYHYLIHNFLVYRKRTLKLGHYVRRFMVDCTRNFI